MVRQLGICSGDGGLEQRKASDARQGGWGWACKGFQYIGWQLCDSKAYNPVDEQEQDKCLHVGQ